MIASLPMYDRPDLAQQTAAFWALIRDALRARGVAAPDALTPAPADLFQHWQAPDLVLSQTCGFPYRTRLHGHVTLIGTPDYGLEGCPPGHYRSVIVARGDDVRTGLAQFKGARLAYNAPDSQSGWAALANEAPQILTGPLVQTGSHAKSALAVADGRADFAALDAVTWRLMQDDHPAKALKVIHATPPTPGLPLIAAKGVDADLVFDCVTRAIDALDAEVRNALGLKGLVRIPAEAYLAVPTPKPPAQNVCAS